MLGAGLAHDTALFFEYPEDHTSWTVENEYLFGEDILVAPLMEDAPERDVYVPPGRWFDYQTGKAYEGSRWHRIHIGEIPVGTLVRGGAAIPHAHLAQSTDRMDWRDIELKVYEVGSNTAEGLFCLPEEGALHRLRLQRQNNEFVLVDNLLQDQVTWRITTPA